VVTGVDWGHWLDVANQIMSDSLNCWFQEERAGFRGAKQERPCLTTGLETCLLESSRNEFVKLEEAFGGSQKNRD